MASWIMKHSASSAIMGRGPRSVAPLAVENASTCCNLRGVVLEPMGASTETERGESMRLRHWLVSWC